MSTATTPPAAAPRIQLPLDAEYWLQGDEDGGVGLQCKLCDRGGAPVALLTTHGDRSYAGTDVVMVYTIADPLEAARTHRYAG